MTTQAICESARSMDAPRLGFEFLDQRIVQDLHIHPARRVSAVTVPASRGAGCPKDEVAVKIHRPAAGIGYGLYRP
jgi:hypothetical protein